MVSTRCFDRGWGVVILNPNDNQQNGQSIRGSETSQAHVVYVFDHIIERLTAERVAVVAHSFGGVALVELLSHRPNCLTKLRVAALTDSVHRHVPADVESLSFMEERVVNFVSSSLPTGEPVETSEEILRRTACFRRSAGDKRHEYTSASAIDFVISHLGKYLR